MPTFYDHWEWIPADQLGAGIEEIAKHVDDPIESGQLHWTRRLCLLPDGKTLGLTFSDCARIQDHERGYPWLIPGALKAIAAAGPIGEVIALLKSDASPEKELARRRAAADEHERRERSEREQQERRAREQAEAQREQAEAATKYDKKSWDNLDGFQQAFALLAIAVEKRGSIALASDLREILKAHTFTTTKGAHFQFPACRWR